MHRIVGSLSTERKRKVLARVSAGQMPVDRWRRPAYTRQHLARRLLSGALHRRRVAALWSRRKAPCLYWYLGGRALLARGPFGGWWRGEHVVCMDINPGAASFADLGDQVQVVR